MVRHRSRWLHKYGWGRLEKEGRGLKKKAGGLKKSGQRLEKKVGGLKNKVSGVEKIRFRREWKKEGWGVEK